MNSSILGRYRFACKSRTSAFCLGSALTLSLACGSQSGSGEPPSATDATSTTATGTTTGQPGISVNPTASTPAQPPVSPDNTSSGPAGETFAGETTDDPTAADGTTSAAVETNPDGSDSSAGSPVGTGDTFDVAVQLASDVDAAAPSTVGIVTWSTTLPDVAEAHIEFGLTTDYGMTAPVNLAEADFRTLLLGMKPSKTYHFRVVVDSGGTTAFSEDYTIETGDETSAVDIGSFEIVDAEGREPGFTIASYWGGPGSSVAFILDQDGEIVWAYDTGISGGIAAARISEDGKNLWVVSASNDGAALRRVGMDGLGAETYAMTVASHDIIPVTGATMAFLDYGESDCDSIFEIDPSGETKEVWDSEDLQMGGGGGTRCHGNAVRFSAPENVFTFSDVGTDLVQVTRDGQLAWKLTEKVPMGNEAWGGVQHGHHLLADSIVVFANLGSEIATGASAVIEYSLDDGAELWRYEGADGEKSANLGDAQRLPGGNTLVTFSNDSIVHEVTADGTIAVKWTGASGTRIGYTEWRSTLYGGSPLLHD